MRNTDPTRATQQQLPVENGKGEPASNSQDALIRKKPIAEELAKKQKEISVAEFFERNKQLLGFDTPTRAMLTSVKEAVDNSLDACEEASILPEIIVEISEPVKGEFLLSVEDNGPGIVRKQIPHVFARLLYGSRFHAIRQSRGQQGIGISAVVMYGQLTTGRPAKIISRIGADKPAYNISLLLDTKKNLPEVLSEEIVLWKKPDGSEKANGTRVDVTLKARYIKGKQSVFEYLKSTAIVNPHARIVLKEPDGTVTIFERVTDKMPKSTVEIKPHPSGIELGTLLKMAKETQSHKFISFLTDDFSRVSIRTAREVCDKAYIDEDLRPQDLNREQGDRIIEAFHNTKIMSPPTDCLSPIGEMLIKKGLKKEVPADFTITITRPPSVYQGQPFQVEAGLVYGGAIPKDGPIGIMRFANRVPLLYQQGACCITHAIESMDWRRYGVEQRGGAGIPVGPIEVLVHVASTKVPFTSESKEAIADIPEIQSQIELAIRECARKLNVHIRRKARLRKMREKEEIIRKILPEIANRSSRLLGKPVPPIEPVIAKIMNSVLIKDDAEYLPSRKMHKIRLEAINYTATRKAFKLFAIIPSEATIKKVLPEDATVQDGMIIWDVKGIPTLERREFIIELEGLDKDDYESELYVDGIDIELVNGAEAWNEDAYNQKRKGDEDEDGEEEEELEDALDEEESGGKKNSD